MNDYNKIDDLETPDEMDILSGVPEDTGVITYKTNNEVAPQGPLRSLAELRADFPNMEILPIMRSATAHILANAVIDIDIPSMAQFCIVMAQSSVLLSTEGRAQIPVAGTIEGGSILVPGGNVMKMYCAGKSQLSLKEVNGANTLVTVLFYVTDKLVNV